MALQGWHCPGCNSLFIRKRCIQNWKRKVSMIVPSLASQYAKFDLLPYLLLHDSITPLGLTKRAQSREPHLKTHDTWHQLGSECQSKYWNIHTGSCGLHRTISIWRTIFFGSTKEHNLRIKQDKVLANNIILVINCSWQSAKTSHKEITQRSSHHHHQRFWLFQQHQLLPYKRIIDFIMSTKSVKFGKVTIMEFPMILGENPAVSGGAPVEIGWEPMQVLTQQVEVYDFLRETNRRRRLASSSTSSLQKTIGSSTESQQTRRVRTLSVTKRAQLLMRAGYSIDEIADTVMRVEVIQQQREESLKSLSLNDRMLKLFHSTGSFPSNLVKGVLKNVLLVGGVGNGSNSMVASSDKRQLGPLKRMFLGC